ncbi:MAG TPA: acyl-CoA dehydrogenase family protein, partial [Bacillota bacterium]
MSSAPCGNWRASSPSAGCAPGPPPSTARAASPATCSTSWPSKGDLADLIIVFAKTDPDRGGRGISAFLVERGTPGLSSGGNFDKLGLRGSPASRLYFDDCPVPAANRLGAEGEGLRIALGALNYGRALHALISVGAAQGAIDYAIDYALRRVQFGRPIAAFQAIRFMLAERAAEIKAARQLAYRALQLADRRDPRLPQAGAMAKWFASEVALRAVNDAMQVLGGHGYLKDHPLERIYRDVRFVTFGEG